MVRTRWKGERVSGKKEDNVIEAWRALLRRGHSLLRLAGSKFKVSLRGAWLKIIEEAEQTNKYVFLENEGADWWGLRTNNWSTCVRKHQKGANPHSGFKRCQLGTLAARGLAELRPVGNSGEHEPWAGAHDDEPPRCRVKPFQSRDVYSHQSLPALSLISVF